MYYSFISKSVCCALGSFILGASLSHAADAFSPESPWMLGDWNGQRTALKQKGYDFNFGYTGELATLLDSKEH